VTITDIAGVRPLQPANAGKLQALAEANAARPRRASSRLAGKEPAMYMDMTTKAVKLRELKDSLKGCSARLQDHVKKNKILSKLSPLGGKSVAALKAAALGLSVPSGANA
jgi:hypothetical protein